MEKLPEAEIPVAPEFLGVGIVRLIAAGAVRQGAVVGVGASLREAHAVVETGGPERLEG